jgi:hypothetical protein
LPHETVPCALQDWISVENNGTAREPDYCWRSIEDGRRLFMTLFRSNISHPA